VLNDIGASRVLDAAKYVAGVSESIIPNGLDFITFRGFLTRGQIIDGFSTGGDAQINLDPVQIERLEIVKGPNAILVPLGSPAGAINITSKKPLYRNQGHVSLEIGQYDSNRTEIDVNRVLVTGKKSVAFRLLAAAQDTNDYAKDTWKRNWTVVPMLSCQLSPSTQVYVQANFSNSKIQNYNGLPLDPSSSTTTEARLIAGVSRDTNIYDLPDHNRRQQITDFRGGLTSRVNDELSIRLAARHITFDNGNQDLGPGGPTGGAIDPRTGLYTPGLVYGSAPDFVSSPTAQPRSMPRGGRQNPFQTTFWNIQNDYAYELKTPNLASTTLAGVALNHFDNSSTSITVTGGNVDFDNVAAYPRTVTIGAVSNNQYTKRDDRQIFLSEALQLFGDRLILNASNTWSSYDYSVLNRLTGVKQTYEPSTSQLAYGLVVKPLPTIALFYGFSEQKTPQNPFSIAVGQKPIQTGKQWESGVRFKLLNKKLLASASYFEIKQDNFAVTNPGNIAVPPPVPLLPPLIADLTSKGWEVEFTGYLTPQLTVIGNYTHYRMRDAFGVRQRAVPDESSGLWVRYEFSTSESLKGFWAALGVHYLGKRPGDQASGLAAGSTPTNPIPNQPTFFLSARTLVDASFGYKFSRQWNAQLNIGNLLDEEYLAASTTRFSVFPGTPINARLRVIWNF